MTSFLRTAIFTRGYELEDVLMTLPKIPWYIRLVGVFNPKFPLHWRLSVGRVLRYPPRPFVVLTRLPFWAAKKAFHVLWKRGCPVDQIVALPIGEDEVVFKATKIRQFQLRTYYENDDRVRHELRQCQLEVEIEGVIHPSSR